MKWKKTATIVIAILINTVSAIIPNLCDTKSCKGAFHLSEDFISRPSIIHKKYKVKVGEVKSTLEAYIAIRKRWTSYCYDGGSLDSNTGCTSQLIDLPPSKSEFATWKKNEGCYIGVTCLPDGDCWGKDAQKCGDKSTPVFVSESKMMGVGQRYLMFPYHTCVSTWECKMRSFLFPIHWCGKTSTDLCSYFSNGTEFSLLQLENGLLIEDGAKLYALESPFAGYIEEEQSIDCFQNKYSFVCLLGLKEGGKTAISIDLDRRIGVYKNYIIYVKDHVDYYDQSTNSIVTLQDNDDKKVNYGSASSIDDLITITSALKLNALRNELNDATTIDSINEIRVVLNKMINSVAPGRGVS